MSGKISKINFSVAALLPMTTFCNNQIVSDKTDFSVACAPSKRQDRIKIGGRETAGGKRPLFLSPCPPIKPCLFDRREKSILPFHTTLRIIFSGLFTRNDKVV